MHKVMPAAVLFGMLCMAWSVPAGKFKKDTTLAPDVKSTVQWIGLKEAEARMARENKPVLIDLYTEWCGWCKVMDKKTYSRADVADYINEHFIPVKLDAETRESISWKGRNYAYQDTYRVNTYALFLTNGQLSFPTTVILPADGGDPQAIAGFLEPKDLESIVRYFGDGFYGKLAFSEYYKNFSPHWK